MALTQAQIQAILSGINPADMGGFASKPDSVISTMTAEEFKQGLECGTLSLEDLNYLFLYGFLATQKSLQVSKDYTDARVAGKKYDCSWKSPRAGNLIVLDPQPDGSCLPYYGTAAEDDVESLYINVNGDNSAAGTEASPLKDAWAALARGVSGTRRRLFFAEGQTHYVDPEHIAEYRGGEFVVSIYGPHFDALPEVVGDHKAMQPAAKALGTKIKSRPAAMVDGYQANAALIPTMGAEVIYIGFAELSPSGDNGSGAPHARNQGTFGAFGQGGSVILRNTDVHLVATSYAFDAYAIANFSLTVEKNVVVTGSGKLITPDVSRSFTLNIVENQAAIVPFLPPLATATKVVTAINTNLDASLLP